MVHLVTSNMSYLLSNRHDVWWTLTLLGLLKFFPSALLSVEGVPALFHRHLLVVSGNIHLVSITLEAFKHGYRKFREA